MKIIITFIDEYNEERTEEIKQMAKNNGVDFVDCVRQCATNFANDIQNEYDCVEGETLTHKIEVIE